MTFLKPKIIISKCLEFDACRYDGQIINNKYIKKLKEYIDFWIHFDSFPYMFDKLPYVLLLIF